MLVALDLELTQDTELHCTGGFVLAEHYGLVRTTGDIDVLESAGTDRRQSPAWRAEAALCTSGIVCTSTS
jgi:hypothetical protein